MDGGLHKRGGAQAQRWSTCAVAGPPGRQHALLWHPAATSAAAAAPPASLRLIWLPPSQERFSPAIMLSLSTGSSCSARPGAGCGRVLHPPSLNLWSSNDRLESAFQPAMHSHRGQGLYRRVGEAGHHEQVATPQGCALDHCVGSCCRVGHWNHIAASRANQRCHVAPCRLQRYSTAVSSSRSRVPENAGASGLGCMAAA